MNNVAEQVAELNKAGVAQAARLAAIVLENAEKVAKVNLLTARSALAQGIENAQAVAGVKDVAQLQAVNTALAKSSLEAAQSYTKTLYALATEAQAQYTALADESWLAYTKGATAWVDKATKSAPAGSEAAVSAFKQGFAASTAAFDQIKEASRKVVSLADANMRAAAESVAKGAVPIKGRKAA